MNPHLQVILGSIGLGALVTYALWLRYRIWAFRQDLFMIRDNLWDDMLEKGLLDSSPHRSVRAGINSLIRLAPKLSLLTITHMLLDREELLSLLDQSKTVPEADIARGQALARVTRYILLETISGLIFTAMMLVLFGFGRTWGAVYRRIAWLFDSGTFAEVDARLSMVQEEQFTSV